MSKTAPDPTDALRNPNRVLEACRDCDGETLHTVSIEIEQETRRPYRVSVCEQCGTTDRIRVNNQ